MHQTTNQAVRYEVRSGVAWITINRPDARNVLDQAVRRGLFESFEHAAADDDASVVVLTGAGDRVFCSGSDLGDVSDADVRSMPAEVFPILNHNVSFPKATIAAVNGVAYGPGLLLAQMCDLCVAARTASFSVADGQSGRGAGWGSMLGRSVPPRIALQLLMTGEPVDAARAREVGLVNEVVSLSDLRTTVQTIGEQIAGRKLLPVSTARELADG